MPLALIFPTGDVYACLHLLNCPHRRLIEGVMERWKEGWKEGSATEDRRDLSFVRSFTAKTQRLQTRDTCCFRLQDTAKRRQLLRLFGLSLSVCLLVESYSGALLLRGLCCWLPTWPSEVKVANIFVLFYFFFPRRLKKRPGTVSVAWYSKQPTYPILDTFLELFVFIYGRVRTHPLRSPLAHRDHVLPPVGSQNFCRSIF